MTVEPPTMRELLLASSLGCPRRACDHTITEHTATDYDGDGTPINPVCAAAGCDCAGDDTAVGCLGGVRCRGSVTGVWRPQTVDEPGGGS